MRNIYLVILLLVFSYTAYGQNKSLIEESSNIVEYNGLGDPLVQSSNSFQNQQLLDEINLLSDQLIAAKENEDISLMRQLEAQINALSGSSTYSTTGGPQVVQANRPSGDGESFDNIGITRIESGAFWATATTTQNDNGRIWVAATKYANGETDTLRIYYSDNGGISWTYFQGFQYAQAGVDFRTDDLDIEVISNGTDWYVYVTGSYNFSGEAWGFVTRYKEDGTGFYYANLPKNSGTNNYWTRLVSDYPRYTGAAYIYIVSTMDSNITGGTHKVFSRAFVIQNPYVASPTLTDRNNGPAGGSNYWWYTASAPDSSTMKSDVAFYDSTTGGGPTVVTCSLFENHGSIGDNIYMTYSDNFMATTPFKTNSFTLTYQASRPSMSFAGGNDQMKGCITVIRKWQNGADTDPWYIATSNGGYAWNQGFVDSSTDTTFDADVICLRGIDGHFKFAWTHRDEPDPEFLYRTGYYTSSLGFTSIVEMYGAGIIPDNAFGGRAGYRLTGGDSCFAVYEGPNGSGVYGASGCTGSITNIQTTEIPVRYSLAQNYPNPFNPSTSIRFEIPTDGIVKLKIYDMLGKEVVTIVNEQKIAGAYVVDFNASGLASGVYFYKLEVNDFSEIRKMTLVK